MLNGIKSGRSSEGILGTCGAYPAGLLRTGRLQRPSTYRSEMLVDGACSEVGASTIYFTFRNHDPTTPKTFRTTTPCSIETVFRTRKGPMTMHGTEQLPQVNMRPPYRRYAAIHQAHQPPWRAQCDCWVTRQIRVPQMLGCQVELYEVPTSGSCSDSCRTNFSLKGGCPQFLVFPSLVFIQPDGCKRGGAFPLGCCSCRMKVRDVSN